MSQTPTIIYTITDEAPALATRSLLPIIKSFTRSSGIGLETRDISLAGRILASFPHLLTPDQRAPDDLAYLGNLCTSPGANIIKLPNISASIPQLKEAIAELQSQGFPVPDYPENPSDDAQREARAAYDKVKGSAVNPVLREGNSDRRAPRAVKDYARQNPHSMGAWSQGSKTRVATMASDDFRSNEQSFTTSAPTTLKVEFVAADGSTSTLHESIPLQQGEIFDASVMRRATLLDFLTRQMEIAREEGILFSLHLKATMMKVSDPIIFGHAVQVYFKDLLSKHQDTLDELGVDWRNGLGDMLAKLAKLPAERRAAIEADLAVAYQAGPDLAMVDSDRGITNLHVPSDVIVDASMPAMIRTSGQMWDASGQARDTLAVIPDSSYATVYQAVIDFCKEYGAFDPRTMGSVPNVGLMAQKAEEYGSHDKTFEIQAEGIVKVTGPSGTSLLEFAVSEGDIWRACQTKDAAVKDWVKLAVNRARATGSPALFWLDRDRAHDAQLIEKVERYLADLDTSGLDIRILAPAEACLFSLHRLRAGEDTISVTGNVLRDYLTDLFPILEVGTSAKMLSIVPLMNGGGLFETGAGGSAPKHVQQLLKENYLRWDSLGEFLAIAVSLEHLATTFDLPRAQILATTLDAATSRVLSEGRSPSRRLGSIDNRGSHFYLALYWAQALAQQQDDPALQTEFSSLASLLASQEQAIAAELLAVQGSPVDIGGYYHPDEAKADAAMRPSATLNTILSQA
jgi:isocitrate dehydrogenase